VTTPVTLVIEGPPVPKARARVTRRGFAFTPARTRASEASIREAAIKAGIKPRVGSLVVRLFFYEADRRRKDIDNLCKQVMDSLNPHKDFPGAWHDDSQIVSLIAHRCYDKQNPRTVVVISDATGTELKHGMAEAARELTIPTW